MSRPVERSEADATDVADDSVRGRARATLPGAGALGLRSRLLLSHLAVIAVGTVVLLP